MRSCNEVITGKRSRPCLEYDIKRCLAPCVDTVCSAEEYARAVGLTRLFLEGRNDELVKTLRARMVEAAGSERFEQAAELRDAIRDVQALHDRQQKMATAELGNRDVFGLKRGPAGVVVQVETWLSSAAGRRVHIVVPQRGEKRGLIDLANRNAALAYQHRFNQQTAARIDALETLQRVLALPAAPQRIECFDISTIQGSETVASMVVCEAGRMRPGEYRKFRIRGEAGGPRAVPNDFAAMHEVVTRRYRRLLEQGGPFPDLILIDGGKGQLTAAYTAFEALGLSNLVAVGIAKREELLYTRDRSEPVAFAENDPALLLMERIRDEAHRFAVTFHRKARRMRDLKSELDRVPGVGPRRRRALLTRFGSLGGVRRASREELAAAVGAKVADAVLAFFAGEP
jgi:excinuclease ABC subunit C